MIQRPDPRGSRHAIIIIIIIIIIAGL